MQSFTPQLQPLSPSRSKPAAPLITMDTNSQLRHLFHPSLPIKQESLALSSKYISMRSCTSEPALQSLARIDELEVPPFCSTFGSLSMPDLTQDSPTSASSCNLDGSLEVSIEDFLSSASVDFAKLHIIKQTPFSLNTPTTAFPRNMSISSASGQSIFTFSDKIFDSCSTLKCQLDDPKNRRDSMDSLASDSTVGCDEEDMGDIKMDICQHRFSEPDIEVLLSGNIPAAAPSSTSRMWKCFVPNCDRVYGTGSGLRYHIRHHHKLKLPVRANRRPKKQKQTSWSCEHCGRVYTSFAGLKYHLNTFQHHPLPNILEERN